MAEMVGSAFFEEAVSGALSYLSSTREENVSKAHNMERLEMAHSELEFALERSSMLPITHMSLLRRRKKLKRAYEECGDVLQRCKLRVQEDEVAEQRVTRSSFPKRITHAVKSSVSSFFSLNNDELSRANVGRFEWYADEAGKFIRDVETGCSLAHYRFFSPLITQLLEGKSLEYEMVQGSQTRRLRIDTMRSEEYGVVASLLFVVADRKKQMEHNVFLDLRLSESTDIIGITITCLQSLVSRLKSWAEVVGELAHLPTQDVVYSAPDPFLVSNDKLSSIQFERLVPLCGGANGYIYDTTSSELSHRVQEQVFSMTFKCYISAFQYSLQSSTDESYRNAVKDWPPLELSIYIAPHDWWGWLLSGSEIIGRPLSVSLQQIEEMVVTKAIDCFIHQPEQKCYVMFCSMLHGYARFTVRKLITGG